MGCLINNKMKKIFPILILVVIGCQFANAKLINDNADRLKALEEKCCKLQEKQVNVDVTIQRKGIAGYQASNKA